MPGFTTNINIYDCNLPLEAYIDTGPFNNDYIDDFWVAQYNLGISKPITSSPRVL